MSPPLFLKTLYMEAPKVYTPTRKIGFSMDKNKANEYFNNEMKDLVLMLKDTDKVELIRFMIVSFVNASRLYYNSMGFTMHQTEERILGDLETLREVFQMRIEQTVDESEDIEVEEVFESGENDGQFVNDATIELYFLVEDIEKGGK